MSRNGASTMPVTKLIAERIGPGGLAGLVILHINHLLNDVLDLNEILLDLGAELIFVPVLYGEKVVPTDLPYTLVYAEHDGATFGLYRDNRRFADGPPTFEAAVKAAIVEAYRLTLALAHEHGIKKVLILEDGGYHFDGLKEHLDGADGGPTVIGAIEQTMAGIRAANRHLETSTKPLYPILSVARSKLKLRFENYFIARRVVEETTLMLYDLEEFLALGDVVLIGYGIIGRPIAALLRKLDCRVHILEHNPKIARTAQWDGFDVIDRLSPELYETSPLILGATGRAAYTFDMLCEFLASERDTLYLVSASSKRVEFSTIITFFEGSDADRAAAAEHAPFLKDIHDIAIVKQPYGLQYTFIYRDEPRTVVLLAEGYPANFYRPSSQSLPSRVIDPINAELLILAQYLFHHHATLANTLHLLGHDPLPGLCADEDEVMGLWTQQNRISSGLINSGIWQTLHPHPNERLLIAPR
jgi:hypothetical protein